MAPSSEACPSCKGVFFGRQKFLICAICEGKFHLSCLKISNDEFICYKQSVFKCFVCLNTPKKSNDETPVRLVSGTHSPEASAVFSPDDAFKGFSPVHVGDPLLAQFEKVVESHTSKIIESFKKQFDNLHLEITRLREENGSLRAVVEHLSLGTSAASVCGSGKYVAAVDEVASAGAAVGVAGDGDVPSNASTSGSSIRASGELAGTRVPSLPGACESWSSVVGRKKRPDVPPQRQQGKERRVKKPLIGCGKEVTSLVAKRTRAFFATRFSPDVSVDCVTKLVGSFGVSSPVVTKLRTRHPRYCSFHILVPDDGFQLLNKPEVWPAGLLVTPFRGILQDKHKFVQTESSGEDCSVSS